MRSDPGLCSRCRNSEFDSNAALIRHEQNPCSNAVMPNAQTPCNMRDKIPVHIYTIIPLLKIDNAANRFRVCSSVIVCRLRVLIDGPEARFLVFSKRSHESFQCWNGYTIKVGPSDGSFARLASGFHFGRHDTVVWRLWGCLARSSHNTCRLQLRCPVRMCALVYSP